jgi:hypothetical protein
MTVKQIEDAQQCYRVIKYYQERIRDIDEIGTSFHKMWKGGSGYHPEDIKAVDEIYSVHHEFYNAELRIFYETRLKEAEDKLASI